MLFDIGWPELMLIGAVALLVIGPKDLPAALRVAGVWVRRARSMSREFQSSVEQMIHEAELDDVRRDLQQATQLDIGHHIGNAIDPDGTLIESVKPPPEITPDYFDEPLLPLGDQPVAALAGPVAPGESVAEPLPEELIEPELPFAEPLPPRSLEPPKPLE